MFHSPGLKTDSIIIFFPLCLNDDYDVKFTLLCHRFTNWNSVICCVLKTARLAVSLSLFLCVSISISQTYVCVWRFAPRVKRFVDRSVNMHYKQHPQSFFLKESGAGLHSRPGENKQVFGRSHHVQWNHSPESGIVVRSMVLQRPLVLLDFYILRYSQGPYSTAVLLLFILSRPLVMLVFLSNPSLWYCWFP